MHRTPFGWQLLSRLHYCNNLLDPWGFQNSSERCKYSLFILTLFILSVNKEWLYLHTWSDFWLDFLSISRPHIFTDKFSPDNRQTFLFWSRSSERCRIDPRKRQWVVPMFYLDTKRKANPLSIGFHNKPSCFWSLSMGHFWSKSAKIIAVLKEEINPLK